MYFTICEKAHRKHLSTWTFQLSHSNQPNQVACFLRGAPRWSNRTVRSAGRISEGSLWRWLSENPDWELKRSVMKVMKGGFFHKVISSSRQRRGSSLLKKYRAEEHTFRGAFTCRSGFMEPFSLTETRLKWNLRQVFENVQRLSDFFCDGRLNTKKRRKKSDAGSRGQCGAQSLRQTNAFI